MAGCATPKSCAGHAPAGVSDSPKLTLQTDHPAGAGQARDGERPRNYVIDLAWKFVSIARAAGCLDEVEIEKLDDMRYELDQYRRNGLTEKNLAVVRAVLSGSVWARVVTLPDRLMADACRLRSTSPVKAAVVAELAVAIRLLTLAPVRIGNLAAISLDTNLTRPGGHGSPYWLIFPGYDVKNRVELTFPFDADVTAFIDRYIWDFRPILLRGSNSSWLFPGGDGNGAYKCASTLSEQITERVEKELGLRITAHQFRHAAADHTLVADITLTPDAGQLRIDLRGELAAILNLCSESKKPASQMRNGPEQIKYGCGGSLPALLAAAILPDPAGSLRPEAVNRRQCMTPCVCGISLSCDADRHPNSSPVHSLPEHEGPVTDKPSNLTLATAR